MKKIALISSTAALLAASQFSAASCDFAYSVGKTNVKSRCFSGRGDAQYGTETGSIFASAYRNGYILRDTILTRNGQDFALRISGSDDPENGYCKIVLMAQDEKGNDKGAIYEATERLGVAGKTECHLKMTYDMWGYGDDADKYHINYEPIIAEINIEAKGWKKIARDESHPDYFDISQSPSAGEEPPVSEPPVDSPEEPPVDVPEMPEEPPVSEPVPIDGEILSAVFNGIVGTLEQALDILAAKNLDENNYMAEVAHLRSRHMTLAHNAYREAMSSGEVDSTEAEMLLNDTLAMIESLTSME